MTKLIPLDAAIAAAMNVAVFTPRASQSEINAAVLVLARVETALRSIPTIDPAAIREAALREAAAKCEYTIRNIQILKPDGETYETPRVQKIAQGLVDVARQEIIALIGEKK